MTQREHETGEPTFRCGWRIKRCSSWPYPAPQVVIQRGEWRAFMQPGDFDAMTDEEFAGTMKRLYSDAAFEQLLQDRDVLARHLLSQITNGGGITVTDVPYDDVKAALYRYQKVKRDTQEAGAL